MDYERAVGEVWAATRPHIGAGKVADYIPDLICVDPGQFGFAVATVDGELHQVGDAEVPFSIQSISKAFALAHVLGRDDASIWRRVNREPSGTRFNSLIQLEIERGVPRNPFINAGALLVTDQLLADTGDACGALCAFLAAETGNPDLTYDPAMAESETRTGNRNRSLAYLMADFGNVLNPVDEMLDHYFRQCSIMASCVELARAGLVLARHGVRRDGTRLLSKQDARRINAIMLTCGTYDAAGEFAYRVGLPCKSGVGGGILAIVPDRCAVAAWGPGLDEKGNSVSAAMALETFGNVTGLSIF
ncbi:glutaminase [Amycolatopsis sp. NPDC023774]|uniref:glutaminase n=1 Tax=Amycolatopsis sp. NPDC023774 TaxID=3155015 RepID=UPI00340CA1D6